MSEEPSPLKIQIVLSIVLILAIAAFRPIQHATSFAVGAGVITLNWFAISFSWKRLLAKKSIALATSVIVIKWAFFGAICIVLGRQNWVNSTWLILGVSTIIPTVLILALKQKN
jgi:hypothetical protein